MKLSDGRLHTPYAQELFGDAPAALLDAIAAWRPPEISRAWLEVRQT